MSRSDFLLEIQLWCVEWMTKRRHLQRKETCVCVCVRAAVTGEQESVDKAN